MTGKMALQRAEFDAADAFVDAHRAHSMTAVVDDDYPQVRHRYEGALARLIKAMQDNGAFAMGNRYGLEPVAPEYQPQPDSDELVITMPTRGVVLWPVGYGNTVSALLTEPAGILFRALTDEQQAEIQAGTPIEDVANKLQNDGPGLFLQFPDAFAIYEMIDRMKTLVGLIEQPDEQPPSG